MKKKHFGPAALIIIILVFSATVICGIISVNAAKEKKHYKSPGPLPEISASNSIDLDKINRLTKEMPGLLKYKQKPGVIVYSDLSLFSNSQSVTTEAKDKSGASDNTGYHLSFAFFSDTKRFCVINGKFYSEGNSLPDGALINTIEAERVLVSKNRLERWLAVAGPGEKIKAD